MAFRNVFGIAILFLAVAFCIQSAQQNAVVAQQQTRQQTNSSSTQSSESFQYARLVISNKEGDVTWLVGGNDVVRTESLRRTFRRLGGNAARIDLANLLDHVGSLGWELVQRDGSTYIFKRRAS